MQTGFILWSAVNTIGIFFDIDSYCYPCRSCTVKELSSLRPKTHLRLGKHAKPWLPAVIRKSSTIATGYGKPECLTIGLQRHRITQRVGCGGQISRHVKHWLDWKLTPAVWKRLGRWLKTMWLNIIYRPQST